MIPKEQLKVGDQICAIYHEGKLGYEGSVRDVVVKKITPEKIIVTSLDGKNEYKFHNDDTMGYVGLEYSRFQFFNLFLGTREEAEKFDKERADHEDLFVEVYHLFMEKYQNLPVATLKKIKDLLK